MARPFVYKKLDTILKSNDIKETYALGCEVMYGIKKGTQWVTICRADPYLLSNKNPRKYIRLFYATENVAHTQAQKLNNTFNTNEYHVVQI